MELDDAFATGSSLMPQKKNSDVAELARGRAGTAIGDLVGLLAVVKNLPLAYNRDLQEDKRPLLGAPRMLGETLEALAGAVETARFQPERMRAALEGGESLATDAAEYLVDRGVPFREAHEAVGKAAAFATRERAEALRALARRVAHLPPGVRPRRVAVLRPGAEPGPARHPGRSRPAPRGGRARPLGEGTEGGAVRALAPLVLLLALAACGVKGPPRPTAKPAAETPESQVAK